MAREKLVGDEQDVVKGIQMKTIYEAICCAAILVASGDLWADFMYDSLNPSPSEIDVWAAEHTLQADENKHQHRQTRLS